MIEELLSKGAENAISTAELLRLTGYKTTRELRLQVEKERRNGAYILSQRDNGGGYFLPSDGEKGLQEMNFFYRACASQAFSTLKTLEIVRKALDIVAGQEMLGGYEEWLEKSLGGETDTD